MISTHKWNKIIALACLFLLNAKMKFNKIQRQVKQVKKNIHKMRMAKKREKKKEKKREKKRKKKN